VHEREIGEKVIRELRVKRCGAYFEPDLDPEIPKSIY
jgi:hypothetical protein